MKRMHNPSHPGELLREYLAGGDISAAAAKLRVARTTLSRVLNGRMGISPAMALRLEETFKNTTAEFWLGMQAQRDIWVALQARKKVPASAVTSRAKAPIVPRSRTQAALAA